MWLAVHMIVATPGRILDLMNKELVKTDACKILVLDEVCGIYCIFFILSQAVWHALQCKF